MQTNQEQALSAEFKFDCQRFAAVVKGAVARGNPSRAKRQLRRPRRANYRVICRRTRARARRKADPQRVIQNAHANVAAGLTAVLIVDRVDLCEGIGTPTRRNDCRDQVVIGRAGIHHAVIGRAVVILNFLQHDDVRRTQVVDNLLRPCIELAGSGVPREILDIESRNRQVCASAHQRCDLTGDGAARTGERLRDIHLVIAEAVIDDTDGRRGKLRADIQVGPCRPCRVERGVKLDTFGVEIAGGDVNAPAWGQRAGISAAVTHHPDFAKRIVGADHARTVDLHAHAFKTFVEVNTVGGWVIGRGWVFNIARAIVINHAGWRDTSACANDHRGRQRRTGDDDLH